MITRRRLFGFVGGAGALGASTAGYAVGIEPLLRLKVTEYRLQPPQWPADLPLRIAVIADLHACEPWMTLDHIADIVDRTNSLEADIVLLLGDYVAGHHRVTRYIPPSEWAPALARLRAPLGVHAILGNHDWWVDGAAQRSHEVSPAAAQALENAGIPVYENDVRRIVVKDGRAFWLAGLGDQLAYAPARRFRPLRRVGADDLDATLAKVTDDAPVILMAHEPDIAVRVPARVSLQLSGHTHGGQVRLLGWAPVVNTEYPELVYGHMRAACDVVVSAGLGNSWLPVRFGIPPEIVLVTLGDASPGQPAAV